MSEKICVICKSKMSYNYKMAWHAVCKSCGYEKANLQEAINIPSTHQLVDEMAREIGLQKIRVNNFNKILMNIKFLKPQGGRLLDVGCAHGWFLEVAKHDFEVLGIEPQKNIFENGAQRGLPIRYGYFPEALRENEKFDIIIFNDVFEHIPDVAGTLKLCHQYLNKEGLLVLNLPNSNGLFYRLAKFFCSLGSNKFFERLWQKGLPSPHLHYFSPSNLELFLKDNRFSIKRQRYLSAMCFSGLYKRISCVGESNLVKNIMTYMALILLLPLLKLLPKDIFYVIASREE